MDYFPMFTMLRGKPVLICGGGHHALEKVERLLPFGPKITVLTEHPCEKLQDYPVRVELRPFDPADLKSHPVFVVAAEDEAENEHIVMACHEANIPVNAVDMPALCDFIFPSMIVTDQLCVGVSTGGASPSAGIRIRNRLKEELPDAIDEILSWMPKARQRVRERIPDKKQQKRVLRQLVERTFSLDRILTEAELDEILSRNRE